MELNIRSVDDALDFMINDSKSSELINDCKIDEFYEYLENIDDGDAAFYLHYISEALIAAGLDKLLTKIPSGFLSFSKIKNYNIPRGVSCIEEGAFTSCHYIENIVIPEGVKSIGDCAFEFCIRLKKISLPDSLLTIGDNAFDGCKNLSNIVIPNNVNYIGHQAFDSCNSLRNIDVPRHLAAGMSEKYFCTQVGLNYNKVEIDWGY